jgi:two-component system KDP operon response regulator KdpE
MTSEPLVLAVDDEPAILRLVRIELTAQGFRVTTASNGAEALRILDEQRPDLVLLDILMDEMSGIEVLRRIRERANVPVIFLTAKGRDADKIRGLELGADDYVTKPFHPDELAARVRAVLRRTTSVSAPDNIVRAADVEVDLTKRLVRRQGQPIPMTRTEWMLLESLAANHGKVMLNSELLSRVWGPEYRDDLQYLRVWVSRLRSKLEEDPSRPRIIKTRYGIGYMFEASNPDGADAGAAGAEDSAPGNARRSRMAS